MRPERQVAGGEFSLGHVHCGVTVGCPSGDVGEEAGARAMNLGVTELGKEGCENTHIPCTLYSIH